MAGWLRRILLVALFALAFGYVESAIVVYLRAIYDPIRASLHPERPPDSLLPLITLRELEAQGPEHPGRLVIEIGREAATIIMLAAVAALAARRKGEWVAFFMIGFGVWDIVYYLGLKAMIGFPESLLTWDILFLIPVPWLGPVLAPLIVALTMILAGYLVLARTDAGRPPQVDWRHWIAILAGAAVIIASFTKDYARTTSGEMPGPFSWPIFAAGLILGLLALMDAVRRSARGVRAS
ncbi:MAG: hypothetical protein ACYSX0_10535 [Planctomycetota bacterium]|jgi:hypothetical protein